MTASVLNSGAAGMVDLRIFGAKKVYILDGGFPAWKAEGERSKR